MTPSNTTTLSKSELPTMVGLTMSSLEIAKLTGKRHDNVMADIRIMLDALCGDGGVLTFQDTYRHPQNGQVYSIFRLPKRECVILVSGYDVTMRAKIVDRWIELEAAVTPKLPDLSDPIVLVQLLTEHAGKRIEAEHRAQVAETVVAEMRPKVEAHDRIAEAHGSFCRSTAAKMLGIPPQTFTRWLRTNGWTFRRPGDKDDLAYQSKQAAGLLEHKIATGDRPDGTQWSSTQVRVTPKGMTVLAQAFPPTLAVA